MGQMTLFLITAQGKSGIILYMSHRIIIHIILGRGKYSMTEVSTPNLIPNSGRHHDSEPQFSHL